jgi:hypothetical protein
MKIAICFWGLTRSLKYTISSIREKILKPLSDKDIEYSIFLHTYFLETEYHNPRAEEHGNILDFEEYKLLEPDYVEVDNQDEVKKKLDLHQYRTFKDPWNSDYICVDNFICAMYSKKRLGQMIEKSGKQFDAYLFVRPDVLFLTEFLPAYLNLIPENIVCIPNFQLFPKFNDRMLLCSHENVFKYTNLFDYLLEYSKRWELHSEICQYYLLTGRCKLRIRYIAFHFNRVRANGAILKDYKPKKSAPWSFTNLMEKPDNTPRIRRKVEPAPPPLPTQQPVSKNNHRTPLVMNYVSLPFQKKGVR